MEIEDAKIESVADERVGEAIEGNLFASWALFSRLRGIEYYSGPDMIRFLSGVAHPLCNHVFRARLAGEDIGTLIDEALAPFKARRVPMMWWTGPATVPDDLEGRLVERGFAAGEAVVCMAADAETAMAATRRGGPAPASLVIEPDDLDAWLEVFAEGFELPAFVTAFFRDCVEAVGLSGELPMRHYLARQQGEPAACCTLVLAGGVAGLYNATTLPGMRRKGLGTAATAIAIEQALEEGYKVVVAQAMPMGVLLCDRLGFEEFYTIKANILES